MQRQFISFFALVLLATGATAARQRQRAGESVHPELEPKSHNKFFYRDYPDDHSPKSDLHFGHPYPEVQDDDHYDKDYVTDKNDDGGYWDAQMKYDKYKNRLRIQKQDMKEAEEKAAEERKEYTEAEKKQDAAEKEAKAIEEKVEKAEDKENKEQASAEKLEEDHVAEAEAEVKTDAEKLKDCEKELEEAKAKLKAAQDKLAGQKKDHAKAKEKEAKLKDKEVKAEKAEEEAEAKEKEEEEEYEEAAKSMKQRKEEVAETEQNLSKAANDLKKFRRADSNGGVHRSNSQRHRPVVAVLGAVAAAVFLAAQQ